MSKTFMQKENKNGKLTGTIIHVSLADWQRYRMAGYGFCEKTKDFDPAAEYARQQQELAANRAERQAENADDAAERTAARAAAKVDGGSDDDDDDDDDDGISMENTKAEILEYLAANNVEADEDLTKAELLELLD